MKKLLPVFLIVLFISLCFLQPVFAQSNHVLPYPSSMPGSLPYGIHLVYEAASRYWYFGDYGQFDYNLKLSDKYLVEAKTLFEYKQYLLGHKALEKSDHYFVNILPNLTKAEKNGKNTLRRKVIFREAAQKHTEILRNIANTIPSIFVWKPEESIPTTLDFKKAINESVSLRGKSL